MGLPENPNADKIQDIVQNGGGFKKQDQDAILYGSEQPELSSNNAFSRKLGSEWLNERARKSERGSVELKNEWVTQYSCSDYRLS